MASNQSSGTVDAPDEVRGADEAIDMLASLLRTLGELGFDTAVADEEQTRESFEAWARHILVGAEPPDGAAALAEGARDWAGLRRFTSERRRDEAGYVKQSLSDLRHALWMFIQGISRAVPDDKKCDALIGEQVEALRSCLDSSDTAEVRRIAMASVDTIEGAIRERSERSRRQIESLSSQVERVAQELVDTREQLERDSLTGVYNRGAFDDFLAKMAGLGMLSGQPATLFVVDIDDFKWVNDHFGHPAGDGVLKEVAQVLLAGFGRRGDFVARYGGDEFAVIVQTEGPGADAELAEACLFRVRDLAIPHDDEEIRVTLSIGGARLCCGESAEEWLACADTALYRAKQEGRDRFAAAEKEGA